MTFLEWSGKLGAHFFRPEFVGRQVFLFVTENLLDELGAETGDTWRDFVTIAKEGHPWLSRGDIGLCQKARHCFETWRVQGSQYPPYIAYLCLFVLAGGKEGDFAPHAYYPRLRSLIGEPGYGMLPGFDKMSELWEGLQEWANDEQGGELGVFTCRRVGGWVHVGVPLAQTILTESERRALLGIFAKSRLDPTSSPSDAELREAVRAYGSQVLRHRTMKLLAQEDGGQEELLDVLIATVREDLEQWDGELEEGDQGAERSVYGSLRLCAVLDRVAGTVAFTLRASMNREFPDSGLVLSRHVSGERFACDGELLNWSTPLQDAGTRARIDGARFDWSRGVELREEQLGWRFRLHGSPVRVFRHGEYEGLPGLLEVHHLSQGIPFVLAARSDCCARIEEWGDRSCEGFTRVTIRRGIPEGWALFRAQAALSDEQVRTEFPSLAFPRSVRLLMRGGIRSGRGNNYFCFGLPLLLLEGGRGDEILCCNGVALRLEDGIFHLPPNLPAGTSLCVEVRRGQEVLRRQSFSLIDGFDCNWGAPHHLLDGFGTRFERGDDNRTGVTGAMILGASPTMPPFHPPASCFDGRQVFFLGPVPGQIVSWPSEDLPMDWTPVWAIPMTRRGGRAVFCGVDLSSADAVEAGRSPYCRKKVRSWKDVVHYRRKRIAPPTPAHLQGLWKQYQEVASRVRI